MARKKPIMTADNLMVVKFETQKIPKFVEKRNKDWVYYGEKNDYPDYIISLYERSPTHNAIVTGKVSYILGEGWGAEVKGTTPAIRASIRNFINNINSEESLDDLTRKLVLDFENNNGFYLEVILLETKS